MTLDTDGETMTRHLLLLTLVLAIAWPGIVFFLLTLAIGIVALHTKINFLVLIFGMMLSASLLSVALSRTAMRRVTFARSSR